MKKLIVSISMLLLCNPMYPGKNDKLNQKPKNKFQMNFKSFEPQLCELELYRTPNIPDLNNDKCQNNNFIPVYIITTHPHLGSASEHPQEICPLKYFPKLSEEDRKLFHCKIFEKLENFAHRIAQNSNKIPFKFNPEKFKSIECNPFYGTIRIMLPSAFFFNMKNRVIPSILGIPGALAVWEELPIEDVKKIRKAQFNLLRQRKHKLKVE